MAQKDGKHAASLTVAEKYVNAFTELARTNNTLILPSNVGDISSLVGQAMSIYTTVAKSNETISFKNDDCSNAETSKDSQDTTDNNQPKTTPQ